MRHEVLFLNKNRCYVLVDGTWYDTHPELNPVVGQSFLTGAIEKVLTYEAYTAKYPESKDEIYPIVADKTISGGFVRKVITTRISSDNSTRLVKYGVNPAFLQTTGKTEQEAMN